MEVVLGRRKILRLFSDVSDVRWINEELSEDSINVIRSSEWFERGWTLQEFLAPFDVTFFDKDWGEFGTKRNLASLLSRITGIRKNCLLDHMAKSHASTAMKMSWASKRKTTKSEDIAYCMLGLFNVNMPLLYGEPDREMEVVSQDCDTVCGALILNWISRLLLNIEVFADPFTHRVR